jgi:hypothetical protein
MAVNDTYAASAAGVSDSGDFIVDASSSGTGAVEVGELGGTGSADVYREVDTNGDGTYEVSVLIDQVTGSWHTQINGLVVSQSEDVRIRVNNTNGSAADFYAVGMEVDD